MSGAESHTLRIQHIDGRVQAFGFLAQAKSTKVGVRLQKLLDMDEIET